MRLYRIRLVLNPSLPSPRQCKWSGGVYEPVMLGRGGVQGEGAERSGLVEE